MIQNKTNNVKNNNSNKKEKNYLGAKKSEIEQAQIIAELKRMIKSGEYVPKYDNLKGNFNKETTINARKKLYSTLLEADKSDGYVINYAKYKNYAKFTCERTFKDYVNIVIEEIEQENQIDIETQIKIDTIKQLLSDLNIKISSTATDDDSNAFTIYVSIENFKEELKTYIGSLLLELFPFDEVSISYSLNGYVIAVLSSDNVANILKDIFNFYIISWD